MILLSYAVPIIVAAGLARVGHRTVRRVTTPTNSTTLSTLQNTGRRYSTPS